MPVYILENEMPYAEYMKWMLYLRDRPIEWRDDQRAAMIMKSFGVKQKAEDLFPSIKQIMKSGQERQKPDQALPTGKFLERMLSASGGDGSTLSWLTGGTNG